jgi:hypothetical protein
MVISIPRPGRLIPDPTPEPVPAGKLLARKLAEGPIVPARNPAVLSCADCGCPRDEHHKPRGATVHTYCTALIDGQPCRCRAFEEPVWTCRCGRRFPGRTSQEAKSAWHLHDATDCPMN